MEHFPAPLTRAESAAFAALIRVRFATDGYGLWAVEVAGNAPFIGFVGLAAPSFDASFTPCTEIGWRLAFDAWGHGYATEAARAVLRDGFTRVGLDEIVSFTATENVRSQRVMQRLGMRFSETFEHPRLPEGHRLRPHVLYRITRDESARQVLA
jgi:RimJ/RimL family protein N-acetyltransferase